MGTTSQFTATVVLTTGVTADVTREVSWQSAEPTVVAVSATGLASGYKVGPAELSVTLNGVTARQRMLIAGPGTYIIFTSDSGDPVGGGLPSATFMPPEDIFVSRPTQDNVSVMYRFSPSSNVMRGSINASSDWFLEFAAPNGQPLTVGTYEGAALWPSGPSTSPRLSFFVGTQRCFQISGRFVIDDVVYGGGSQVQRLHATFDQFCDGRAAGLHGDVGVNR